MRNDNIPENEKDNLVREKSDKMELEEDDNIYGEKNEENKNMKNINIIHKDDYSKTESILKLLRDVSPKIIENYEIKECIGSGSESVVFKIIFKKTNKPYAMKIIFTEKSKKRNINELIISNKFKHNNIIKFYGLYEIQKNKIDSIIMEYAKFGNLRDFKKKVLKRDVLSEQLLCFLAFQILSGIKHCHACKVVHSDLKPQNIIIDEFLNIKIIDFSVSLDYSNVNSSRIKFPFRGTNFYMPPEVIKSKTIDVKDLNKIDLYSLGVILYNLAFDTYPYNLNREDCNNYDKIYEKITKNQLTFNNEENHYSKYFIDILKQLLEKDINKRININLALNHYWTKGANILFDEKEKIFNASSFLIYLLTDHFQNYDKYINL